VPTRWVPARTTSAPLRPATQFYEEIRIYMAKVDAEARRTSERPVPEDIQRLLVA